MAKYDELVTTIVEEVGGKENISFATHCMTRLRLNLKDQSKVNQDDIKNIPGVLGSQFSGGQFQIIIGQHVADVYKEFIAKTGLEAGAPVDENLDKKPFNIKDLPKNMIDAVAGCVAPILPIITAAGIFKLFAALFGPSILGWLPEDNLFLQFLTFIGDTGFYFFPVYLAWAAANKFKTNAAVAMMLGACLIHPTFLGFVEAGDPISVFGIPMALVNYSSQFLPSLLAVWVMSYVYRWVDGFSPNSLKILLVPTLTLMIMIPLTFLFIGPLAYYIGIGISWLITFIHSLIGPVAIALVGGLWYFLVVTGMHQTLIALMLTQIATNGFDSIILPGGTVGTFALFGVALAYVFRCASKDRALATTNAVTLIAGGISEPFLFSTLIRFKQAMIAYFAGGAIGGLLAGIMGVRVFFMGATNVAIAAGFGEDFGKGIICALIAFAVSFAVGFFLGFGENKPAKAKGKTTPSTTKPNEIQAPLSGEVISIEEVNDPAFSSKAMGDGAAIIPAEGVVKAPFDGEVVALFPTKHAIGLKSNSGIEVLIHVGLDTVQENGKGFSAKVKQGDKITAGQTLIEFDMPALKEKGYDLTTPVIITDLGKTFTIDKKGAIKAGEPLMEVKE